jgi:hypothetical protein
MAAASQTRIKLQRSYLQRGNYQAECDLVIIYNLINKMKAICIALLGLFASAHVIQGTIDRKGNVLDYSKVRVTMNNGEYSGLVD